MLYLRELDYRCDAEALKSAYESSFDARVKAEEKIRKENRKTPFILIITCTRIAVYSYGNPISFESIERALSLNHIRSMDKRRKAEGADALRHFYTLSLGLESPLFGEALILSQIKEARERAIRTRNASSYLLRLSQDVIAFAKEMHSRFKIRVFDAQIGDAVASYIDKGKKVLIIGSGELSRIVADALIDKGCKVSMTLRDMDKTFLLSVGTSALSYDERHDRLKDFDVVISSSSGIYHTLDEKDAEALCGKLLFDLAQPYDIPSSLNPVRLSDMNVETPLRDALLSELEGQIEARMDSFNKDIEMKAEAMRAEDFSASVLKRMRFTIRDLCLDDEKEKSLEETLYESIRKAYIENERKFRRQ